MFIKFAHFCIALSQLDLVYLMCRIVIYMHTVTQPQSHRPPMFVFCNFGIFRGKLPGSQILWVSCANYSAHFTLSIWFCQRVSLLIHPNFYNFIDEIFVCNICNIWRLLASEVCYTCPPVNYGSLDGLWEALVVSHRLWRHGHRHRQTITDTGTDTDTDNHSQTQTNGHRHSHRQTVTFTDKQSQTEAQSQTNRHRQTVTGTFTDKQSETQAQSQTKSWTRWNTKRGKIRLCEKLITIGRRDVNLTFMATVRKFVTDYS